MVDESKTEKNVGMYVCMYVPIFKNRPKHLVKKQLSRKPSKTTYKHASFQRVSIKHSINGDGQQGEYVCMYVCMYVYKLLILLFVHTSASTENQR